MEIISKSAKLGLNVAIGNNVTIKDNVTIGNNVTIYDNVVIEENVYIWDNAVIGRIPMGVSSIFSEVRIEKGETYIKKDSVIGCNAVIYTDTFIGEDSLVSDNVVIRERCTLKGNNIIGPNTLVQKDCKLGMGTRIIQQSTLATGTVIGDNNFISSGFVSVSDSTFGVKGYSPDKLGPMIGDNNLIGPDVTVLDNLKIGNYNLIGAKALITKTIGDNGVYFGIPARFVRERNKNISLIET